MPMRTSLRVLFVAMSVAGVLFGCTQPPKKNEPWRQALEQVYRLDEREIVRYIPPPFIPERQDFVESICGPREGQDPHNVMCLRWVKDQKAGTERVAFRAATSAYDKGKTDLLCVLDCLALSDVHWDDCALVRTIGIPPGDWIVRAGQPAKEVLSAVAKICRERFEIPIRFEKTWVEKEVVIPSGTCDYSLLEDSELTLPSRQGGWAAPSTNLWAALQELERNTGVPFIRDGLKKPKRAITFTLEDDNTIGFSREEDKTFSMRLEHDEAYKDLWKTDSSAALEQLLNEIRKQMGLAVRREKRTIEVFKVILEDEDPETKPPEESLPQ